MVEHLQRYGVIQSKKVAEVMETVDRALFVPDGSSAYEDSPMQIGFNATISAPHMHATCLQLLEKNLQPGMHALDVGSGILSSHLFFLCPWIINLCKPSTMCFQVMNFLFKHVLSIHSYLL